MKITHLQNESGTSRFAVEADWSGLAADYEDIVSAYANVRLPGYRPGKVPRSMIENRFRKQILDDFSQRVAQRLGREALRTAGAGAMGPIEMRDIECGKGRPFRFVVRFWPMPEMELPDLATLAGGDDGSDPRDLVSRHLLERVRFPVPEQLVRAELGDGGDDGESGQAAWEAASDRVRLMLILKKIAEREGIEVSEADVEQRIREKASEFGEDVEPLRTGLREGGGWQRLREMLLAEETLTYLLELHQKRQSNQEGVERCENESTQQFRIGP